MNESCDLTPGLKKGSEGNKIFSLISDKERAYGKNLRAGWFLLSMIIYLSLPFELVLKQCSLVERMMNCRP